MNADDLDLDEYVPEIEEPYMKWERLPSDTPRSYEAFCCYRDAGPGRSLAKVGQTLGKSRQLLERWSVQHNFRERAEAFDFAQEIAAREARAEAQRQLVSEFQARCRVLSVTSNNLSVNLLRAVTEDFLKMRQAGVPFASYDELSRVLGRAAQVATLSMNAESQIVGVGALLNALADTRRRDEED